MCAARGWVFTLLVATGGELFEDAAGGGLVGVAAGRGGTGGGRGGFGRVGVVAGGATPLVCTRFCIWHCSSVCPLLGCKEHGFHPDPRGDWLFTPADLGPRGVKLLAVRGGLGLAISITLRVGIILTNKLMKPVGVDLDLHPASQFSVMNFSTVLRRSSWTAFMRSVAAPL